MSNISGTCGKGISLANIKNAKLQNINVSGYSGNLLNIYNVTGQGLEGADTINEPKLREPILPPSQPYQLK